MKRESPPGVKWGVIFGHGLHPQRGEALSLFFEVPTSPAAAKKRTCLFRLDIPARRSLYIKEIRGGNIGAQKIFLFSGARKNSRGYQTLRLRAGLAYIEAGVCGNAGVGVENTLIESNLIEHVGYQDVELAWETGGIKLHLTKNCLLRANVIRHTVHAEAIWLDYENANTRVTGNVMGDTLETLRGGIYLEASHEANMIDNNIIWRATEGAGGGSYNMPAHGGWGITVDGSDEIVIAHNLIGLTQDAAIKFRNIEGRIVSGRGGTTRRNKVLNNIFYRCCKAIDFSNSDNTADGNLYTEEWGATGDENQGVGRGLNWIPDAGAILRLDLEAWRKFFGFDKNGAYAGMTIDVDLDALTLAWGVSGAIPEPPTGKHFQRDLVGQTAGAALKPGPLLNVPEEPAKVSIDPRR